jgi:hypothetical protein
MSKAKLHDRSMQAWRAFPFFSSFSCEGQKDRTKLTSIETVNLGLLFSIDQHIQWNDSME